MNPVGMKVPAQDLSMLDEIKGFEVCRVRDWEAERIVVVSLMKRPTGGGSTYVVRRTWYEYDEMVSVIRWQ